MDHDNSLAAAFAYAPAYPFYEEEFRLPLVEMIPGHYFNPSQVASFHVYEVQDAVGKTTHALGIQLVTGGLGGNSDICVVCGSQQEAELLARQLHADLQAYGEAERAHRAAAVDRMQKAARAHQMEAQMRAQMEEDYAEGHLRYAESEPGSEAKRVREERPKHPIPRYAALGGAAVSEKRSVLNSLLRAKAAAPDPEVVSSYPQRQGSVVHLAEDVAVDTWRLVMWRKSGDRQIALTFGVNEVLYYTAKDSATRDHIWTSLNFLIDEHRDAVRPTR